MIRRPLVSKIQLYAGSISCIFALSFLFSFVYDASYSFSFVCLFLSLCLVILLRCPCKKVPWWQAFFFGMGMFFFQGSITWALNTFPLDDFRSVVLTLQTPLDGFVLPFVFDYLLKIIVVGPILIFLSLRFFKSYVGKFSVKGVFILLYALALWNALFLYAKIPVEEYWNYFLNRDLNVFLHESTFWQRNYSDADSLKISGGGRNLILIIMESMENWPDGLTPEIERMAEENLSFSDIEPFGGGANIAGAENTYCSTVSKTTGVPMLRRYKYPGTDLIRIKGIYDVLHDFGYKNIFLQGTDANFSGLNDFMMHHGIDTLYDMNNLKDEWDMDSFFRNFRTFSAGITDKRLYDISKEVLDTLSNDKFSLTIATIETHFPYGFYDKNCLEKPESFSEKSKFKATLQCASRQVYEFVDWVKKQSFFENTQIVIVGDHLFMGNFFVENRNRRWVDIFMNAAVLPPKRNRRFTSIDMAPTILEGMGFQIEGHKMGLGTSLFSDSLTLYEKMGWTKLNSELIKLENSVEYNQQYWGNK
ncbi:MAG: LTA synthase family protein [Fibrobacter sp.]|nr:LTA synthase family protein [Fibrobacter sp.]